MKDISLLCQDLLLSIFEFLEYDTITRISRTNKELYDFCNNYNILWKVLIERDCENIEKKELSWGEIYDRNYHTNRTNEFCKNMKKNLLSKYEDFLKYKMFDWNILIRCMDDVDNTKNFLKNCPNKILKYVIDNTIDLECQTKDGWRPIHFICYYSTPEMIKYIIDKEVDLYIKTMGGINWIDMMKENDKLDKITIKAIIELTDKYIKK